MVCGITYEEVLKAALHVEAPPSYIDVAVWNTAASDPLFWSLITQPDDDFFEMYRGLVYGGNGAAGSDAGGGVAGVGGLSSSPSTTFASSLLGAFRRVKAKATGTSYGLTDENGVPVLEGERAKFALCETVHDAVAQEMKLTKMSGSDRQGHTSAVAPICSSLDVADTWWECEGNLTEANLVASTRSAAAAVGVNSDSDGSGRQGLVSSPMGGYTLQQSQKERLLESQLVRRQRRDEELEALQKRFTEKLLTQINAHLRLPNTETKPRNLSTMMLASCAIDRAFFSCDKLKEVIASSYFFQNELLRNDGLYYAWGESLVAIYKLRVALDGLQEASRDASEAWKEFCCTHYWPYTREKVTEEELKPKLSPRVHTSNRLTHYTLRSASVLAQVSQTEKGIITEGFVSAVTTGAMLAAAHRWRCAVLHQQLHRGNSVLPSARLASGGWGVVAAGGSPALPRAQPTSNKLSDQHNSIPCGPGSILASSLKALSVGKAATGLPASFVSGCAKLITPASGKTGRNIFQLQKDLKRVCEEGNGVPELETLDMIDEDSSIIQDFLDVSTSSFEDHHAQIQKQLLHPQLLSTIHEMVLYQKLSWQATEMVAKEFQRIIDQDLFLEALTEELPFLDISKSSIPPPHSVRYTQTPNGDVVASTSSTALATTTQFGSVASMFRRRRAAQHVEEEAGEAAWRARQERMEAEKLHNTHGGHYMGESTTYYTSSPGGGHHADDHGASSKGGKPRSSSLFTWKKTGPPSSAPSSQSRRHGGGGGGEEMTEMTSSHSGKADATNNNYGGTAYGGGQKNPSTLEANNYRHSAIRAKVSELGSSAYSYHGGYGASINDDFDANPFDVPTGRPPPIPTQPKRVVRSLSPKFSPNDDDEDSTGSPWNKGRSVFGKDTKSRTFQVPPQPSNRVSIVPDEEVFASSFSGDMSRKKKGWGERATAQKRPSMSHDDPFGGA